MQQSQEEFELKHYIFIPEGELSIKISKLDAFLKNAIEKKKRSDTENQTNSLDRPTAQDIRQKSFSYIERIAYAIGIVAVVFFFFIQPIYTKYFTNNTQDEQVTKTKQDLDNLTKDLAKAREENQSLQTKLAEKEGELNTVKSSATNLVPSVQLIEVKFISDQDIASTQQKHKVTLKLKQTSKKVDLSNIKIQIINIRQKYTDGIELPNGVYKIQLTHGNDTIKPLKQYIFIIDEKNTQPDINLELPL